MTCSERLPYCNYVTLSPNKSNLNRKENSKKEVERLSETEIMIDLDRILISLGWFPPRLGVLAFFFTWRSLCDFQGSDDSEWSPQPKGSGGGSFTSSLLFLPFLPFFPPFLRPCFLLPHLHRGPYRRTQYLLYFLLNTNFMIHVTKFKVDELNILYGILSKKIKTSVKPNWVFL